MDHLIVTNKSKKNLKKEKLNDGSYSEPKLLLGRLSNTTNNEKSPFFIDIDGLQSYLGSDNMNFPTNKIFQDDDFKFFDSDRELDVLQNQERISIKNFNIFIY